MPQSVIREAGDGRVALTEMTKKKVDVIITDLQMPNMDGRTFLRMIRKNPLLKAKPIIVLSSDITPELIAEHKDDIYIRFLAKPAKEHEIIAAVRAFLPEEGL
jgi:CheY-like chemotaxis protein